VSRLAQITPIVRGLLTETTGQEDLPYKPVSLKSLTNKEAIDFAGLIYENHASARRDSKKSLVLYVIGGCRSIFQSIIMESVVI